MQSPSIKNNVKKLRWPRTIVPGYQWNITDVEAGNLRVTLARNDKELDYSKQLRYEVFIEEMGAKAKPETVATKRDSDEFDDHCDHLLVIDDDIKIGNPVVGTYRLLRRKEAEKLGKFYSENEFDISKIVATKGEILELGRSCVRQNYRTRAVMQLLWRGIGQYVFHHNIKLMFGCASFPGSDINKHATQLSYLYHNYLAPDDVMVTPLTGQGFAINEIAKEAINNAAALTSLPPLIKGYLRLGGCVGNGAVIDKNYNTTDVCIILKTDEVSGRYFNRYAPDGMK